MTERALMHRLFFLTLFGLSALLAPVIAQAQQGLFAPRLIVNDQPISGYELEQRIRFLQLLRAPGDPAKLAMENLIEDRLRTSAGKQFSIVLTPEQVQSGMDEFASRANLTTEQFIAALEQNGVAAQTFRDFVTAGLTWREVIRARFAGTISVSDTEIDRAITAAEGGSETRLLLSEIVIKADDTTRAAAMAEAKRLKRQMATEVEFAAMARRISSAPSATRGGVMEATLATSLPERVAPLVKALPDGQISDPVSVPGGVAIYFKRGVEQKPVAQGAGRALDYAQFLFPNDDKAGAEAARIRAKVDTCNDLYGVAKGLAPERLTRVTQAPAQVPQDIAAELVRLDPGESSTALVRGSYRVFLMLCNRSEVLLSLPDRQDISQNLLNQKLNARSELLLQELRSEALIREP